jgi:LPXTG-motif cell wall-anchored protein
MATAVVAGAGLALVAAGPVFAATPVHGVAPAAPHPIVVQAPGDQISVSVPGVGPDFGYVKQGNVITRTIEILNDGVDSITIDPATFNALAAPFTLVSTTIVKGVAIAPGQRKSVTVTYTAPPAGTKSSQLINLQLVDFDRPGTGSYAMQFMAESLATDRAHFEATTAAGASTVAFGSVKVGASAVVPMKLVVQGIDPLFFKESAIEVKDQTGKPLPVTVSKSSFGSGKTFAPGDTATFELTFAPTAAGTYDGTVTIIAQVMNGDPETPALIVVRPLTGSAPAVVIPTPAPTPTPVPTTTPSTPTPRPTTAPGTGGTGGSGTGTGTGTSGSSVSGIGSGAGSGSGSSLAHTGGSPVIGLGFAGLTLALGGGALALVKRSRRRLQRD